MLESITWTGTKTTLNFETCLRRGRRARTEVDGAGERRRDISACCSPSTVRCGASKHSLGVLVASTLHLATF
jgi:hypothetical protein